jgi:glycosyltransferase involved in cell wall biosynthesis
MASKKKIFFTVTNDLVYDQRMQRICNSMAKAGYEVTLVGRKMPDSPPLSSALFKQVRIPCRYQKGKLFYLEYNYRLYRYLMKQDLDAVCAIDLDTLLPVYRVSKTRNLPRMYDAHEYYTEMIEVKSRPHIYWMWKTLENFLLPKFPFGYTVGSAIAAELNAEYGVSYALVRNMPHFSTPIDVSTSLPDQVKQILSEFDSRTDKNFPIILYQGAINKGRALPELLEAMHQVDGRLLLAGSGNLDKEVAQLIADRNLAHKVWMCGSVTPHDLRYLTAACHIGVTIFDALSKNQYYSLGNKFFDYIMAHKPQVCVHYPEYAAILKQYPVAEPIEDTKPVSIAHALNKLLKDPVVYQTLERNCKTAGKELNWENEEKTLLTCWKELFQSHTF